MATKKPQINTQETRVERAPVVVIMGHIDHGKSTLLDYIRKTNICEKEAGGITQHISACEVVHEKEGQKKKITFLDTPGHAAFVKMRSRGATAADIAILVVSAEDGVKPQTLEALQAIKSAGLPFVVAINKIDKPTADLERTKQNLAESGIYLEGYGGDISWTAISAKTGEGVGELLDLILLMAEFANLTGDRNKKAEGIVIETKLDTKKGISATLIIKDGTLSRSDYAVAGDAWTPIRIMEDFLGKPVESASFSSPVQVIGWSKLPEVGNVFYAIGSKKEAETAASLAKKTAGDNQKVLSAELSEKILIPIILKTDTVGSYEGIEHEIAKIKNETVSVHIIQNGIGPISEIDIKGALGAKDAVVLGFNVKIDSAAQNLAERSGIIVKNFDIIYKLSEYLEALVVEHTPKPTEEIKGVASIVKVFSKQKDKQVIGGKVASGAIKIGEVVTIRRRGTEIGNGKIRNLQQMKADVDTVLEGKDFGAQIESKIELAPNDEIESVKLLK